MYYVTCFHSLFDVTYGWALSTTDAADEMARVDSNRFHEVVGVLDELHNDGTFSTFFRYSTYVQRDGTPIWTHL